MELPTFAFPPDPLSLALVPAAPTVEKEKSLVPIWRGPMALVQPCDALNRRSQQFVVSRHGFLRRVCPVGKERETKIAVWIRQVVDFQPLDLLRNLGLPYQESRYNDQCPQIRRHSIAEREPGQRPWPDQLRDFAIHQCARQIRGRDESEKPEQQQAHYTHFCCTGIEEEQSENEAADKRDGGNVPRCRLSNVNTNKPSLDGHAKAEFLLEGYTPVRDEVIAGVPPPVPGWLIGSFSFAPETLRVKNRQPGNFKLIVL
jgi:hypothetical protein